MQTNLDPVQTCLVILSVTMGTALTEARSATTTTTAVTDPTRKGVISRVNAITRPTEIEEAVSTSATISRMTQVTLCINGGWEQSNSYHFFNGIISGYLCLCDRGYSVNEHNPKKCDDIDECSNFGHNCTQVCSNLKGTYDCSCVEGFTLTDRFSGVCRSSDGIEPKLLYSTGEEIYGQTISKQLRQFDVIKNESRIESIDFDPKDMMLYWADSEEKSIRRSLIPGTSAHPEAHIGHAQEIITVNAKITSVAHDSLTGNIYWTEIDRWTGISSSPRGVISVAKNDGRYKRELVAGQLVRRFYFLLSMCLVPMINKMQFL